MSYFDDHEDRIIYGRACRPRQFREDEWRTPRCRYCGSTDVRWRQQTGRWVLFNLKAGEEHNCRSTTATPGDFD